MDDIYREIVRNQEQGRVCALATIVRVHGSTPGKLGAKMLITEDGRFIGSVGGGCVENQVWQLARKAMHTGAPIHESFKLTPSDAADEGLACGGQLSVFIEPIVVPTVYIFGAGHVGAALARLVHDVGFKTVVIDDREQFANKTNIPTADEFIVGEFETMLASLVCRPHTYAIVVTRGHKYDGACLQWCVSQPADNAPVYIGMISSRAKRAVLYKRLEAEGVSAQRLEAVYAPIGLAIGAVTPQEIAISICAQLIAHRRGAALPAAVHQHRAPRNAKPGASVDPACQPSVAVEADGLDGDLE